jgi:hypothetical protein
MPVIITNPLAGDLHVNRPLTNFAQKWVMNAKSYVASQALPNNPVAKQGDLYWEFDRADWLRDEAQERADGTESSGSGFDLSTTPYFAKVYAHHKVVTDRQRANSDSPVFLDEAATQFVMQKLLIKKERVFSAAFMVTGTWTGSTTGGDITPSPKWDAASGNPIKDIRTQQASIHGKTGMWPNRMIFTRSSWNALLDSDGVLDRVSGGATSATPANVQKELIAGLLELDQINVMDAVFNSASKGDAEATAPIGPTVSDAALLYYAPLTPSMDSPTAGQQFSWTGLIGNTELGIRIKRIRDEHREADKIEGQMAFDFKRTAMILGAYFTDTNT